MADRHPLRLADRQDIPADDPFAELTRIMGFDPRQPVRSQAAARPATTAVNASQDDDLGIDLEKELMGDLDRIEDTAPQVISLSAASLQISAPVSQPSQDDDLASQDDDLAAVLEQELQFDDAVAQDETGTVAEAVEVTAPETSVAPRVGDDVFAPLGREFRIADGGNKDEGADEVGAPQVFAADEAAKTDLNPAAAVSLYRDFRFEDGMSEEIGIAEQADVAQADSNAVVFAEPVEIQAGGGENVVAMAEKAEIPLAGAEVQDRLDQDFNTATADSLEIQPFGEENFAPELHEAVAVEVPNHHVASQKDDTVPAEAGTNEDPAGQFGAAIAEVAFDVRSSDAADEAPATAALAEAIEPEAFATEYPAPVEPAMVESLPDDAEAHLGQMAMAEAAADIFDLNVPDILPAGQLAADQQPEPEQPELDTIQQAVAAPTTQERTLEDELNALIGRMGIRSPLLATPAAQQPLRVVASEETGRMVVAADAAAPEKPFAPVQPAQAAASEDADGTADLVDQLDWDDEELEPAPQVHAETAMAESAIEAPQAISDSELNDLLAGGLDDLNVEETQGADQATSLPEVEFDDEAFDAAFAKGIDLDDDRAAESGGPQASGTGGEDSVKVLNWPTSNPSATGTARSWSSGTSASHGPAPVWQNASAKTAAGRAAFDEEAPEIETVDVPERVVALTDDLDIPILTFEEERPTSPNYDDLDAEFATLLGDMNTTDLPDVQARGKYEDEPYQAGFRRRESATEATANNAAFPPIAAPAGAPATSHVTAISASARDKDNLVGRQPLTQPTSLDMDDLEFDPALEEVMALPEIPAQQIEPRRRGLLIAGIVCAVAVVGGVGAFALSLGGGGDSEAPALVKADNRPIKIKPENPGGAVVPNQDNRVYDVVANGAKPAAPKQEKLVTDAEEPVDVTAKAPQDSAPVLPDQDSVPAMAAENAGTDSAAPTSKSEDRIAQVVQEADASENPEVAVVAPRKVRTMVVKPDGSLVPREDPAPQVAATEPADPAPQRVVNTDPLAAGPDQTGAVPPAAGQPDAAASAEEPSAVKPADEASALPPVENAAKGNAQSTATPKIAPIAPQRPSDQPVDVVGEVKPDQVASIDPATAATAASGSWSMQIASQPSVESAQSTYQDLARRYGTVLGGHTANIVKAEIAGKGTFYRVRVPAGSRNEAIKLCESYKAAGGNCFVSK